MNHQQKNQVFADTITRILNLNKVKAGEYAANDDAHQTGLAPEFVDEALDSESGDAAEDAAAGATPGAAPDEDGDRGARRGRRRGRRGGRRGREQRDGASTEATAAGETAADQQTAEYDPEPEGSNTPTGADPAVYEDATEASHVVQHEVARASTPEPQREAHYEHAKQPALATADRASDAASTPLQAAHQHEALQAASVTSSDTTVAEPERKPEPVHQSEPVQVTQFPEAPEDPNRPRRRGWWQRRGLGE